MRSDAVSAWADDPRETYRHHSTVRDELGCTGLQEATARPSSEPDTRRASRTRSGPSTRQHGQRTSLGKQGDDPPHGGLQQDRPRPPDARTTWFRSSTPASFFNPFLCQKPAR